LLSDSANCTVLRAVVLTQYRRLTDGRNCCSYYSAYNASIAARWNNGRPTHADYAMATTIVNSSPRPM